MSAERPPIFAVFKRADGLFDWKLVAGNGEEVCGSLQGYTSEADAIRGFETASRLIAEVRSR
jgi:uncharacterized protein YegP (UPF0339 family)